MEEAFNQEESLYEKSMAVLELPQVLALCARHAVSPAAKERILALRPQKYLALAQQALEEAEAARSLLRSRNAPAFSGVRDVAAALDRAEKGGSLNLRELMEIGALLQTARLVKGYLDGEERRTPLDSLFSGLQGNRFLEDRIAACILSEEELADLASPELADLRRHQRSIHERIRAALQKMISSSTYQKMLQEPIVTIRDDRYVVPVKAEYRSGVPGLVHDVSASGATYFIEPMQAVQLNNQLRELQSKEEAEIRRILAELSAQCAEFASTIRADYQRLVTLDEIFARGKYAREIDAVTPELGEDGACLLKNARHPLLDPKKAVPITIDLGRSYDTLVITGPNTGGKTVALKTTGLLTLMAQCGLQIPADPGSRVSLFRAVYADIGDEQSIQQSLSTFSAHMKNIVAILAQTDRRSLVLFDELGAGTDPVEGAALAVAVIQHARRLGARIAATTHYAELKEFAMTTPGVENASCEFDVETLQPTYRLLIGIPGRSNAFAISLRLGLPEQIVADARELVGSEDRRFEDLLREIEEKRQDMELQRRQASADRRAAEEARTAAETRLHQMDQNREKLLDTARQQAQELLDNARREADAVMEELRRLRRQQQTGPEAGQRRAEVNRRLNQAEQALRSNSRQQPEEKAPALMDLKQGETVELIKLGGVSGVVLTPPDREGRLRVQAGVMQMTVRADEVRRAKVKKEPPAVRYLGRTPDQLRMMSARTELDLRGMTVSEALLELDQFLDNAVLAGLPSVSVIHGKGTGALRAAVHEALKGNRQVARFRLGRYGEGETGVTIVELV